MSRAKVVQTVHGLDQDRSKWGRVASTTLGVGCWLSARVPDATVVVSRSLEEHYRVHYGRQTHYICNGVDQPDPAIADGTLAARGLVPGSYVLFVGRLVPEKAPDLLLRAFRRIGGDDMKLVLAGGSSFTAGYVESLESLAAQDPRVVMTGYVHGIELAELYAGAAVFVLPSAVEGMPLTLLEAAAHGTPILASDIPPHREMLGADQAGRRMFRSGDEHDLTRRLRAILDRRHTELVGAGETALWVHKVFNWGHRRRAALRPVPRAGVRRAEAQLRDHRRPHRPRRTPHRAAGRRAPDRRARPPTEPPTDQPARRGPEPVQPGTTVTGRRSQAPESSSPPTIAKPARR
jgi:glycosyltransferase involved in cell wall biosynthesis